MYLLYSTFYRYFRVYSFYLLKKISVQQHAVLRLQTSALFRLFLWMRTFSEIYGHEDMGFFHSDSKTDLKVRRDNCIKFQLIEGA